MRVMTDTRVSPLWMLLPVVAAVLGLIWASIIIAFAFSWYATSGTAYPYNMPAVGLFAGTTVFVLLGFLALYVAFLYVVYLLIRRRNQHFARQQRFFADLAVALREAASRKGANVEAYLGSMEATSRQAQIEETEKSAVLWVILYVIPVVNVIAGLYILYFLTGDFFKHERREDGMLSDATRALYALGATFSFNRYNGIPSRSFVLYFILSIVTFGLFIFYWEYVLIQDPNNHFNNHVQYEDALLQSISPLLG
jgi:uncharacterized membrane protein